MPRPPRPALALAAWLTGLAGGVLLPGAAVAADPVTAVVVRGHGYGHGHGLSQYGAEGAARQGLSAARILAFYYPGTEAATSGGRIRVYLSGDDDAGPHDVVVGAAPGELRVRAAATRSDDDGGPTTVTSPPGEWRSLPDNGATRWRLVARADGGSRLGYLTDAWHAFAQFPGDAEFGARGTPLSLVAGGAVRDYRGRLGLATRADGQRVTVNDLGLDQYVRGVVPLEMPASWTPAAVQSQAVAARTYAAYEREHPLSQAYDLCDTGLCQVYGGVGAEQPGGDDAVAATARTVLLSDGEPAFTQFGSSNGGWSAAGSAPYLVAEEDPYDGWDGNPVHTWRVSLTAATIQRAFPAIGTLRGLRVVARDGHGDWGGRAVTVRLTGSKATLRVSGETFRGALGLRSTWFAFRVVSG